MKKQQETKKHEKQENEEFKNLENQLKRALADYQNLEKRIAEEKSSWIKAANKDLLLKLLPGFDSLLLAEKHTEDEGVKLSIKHFLDILEQEGVRKIETVGKDFDPNFHEAVAQEYSEGKKPNEIIKEFQKGYILNGRLVRPAKVVVASDKQ